MPKLLDLVNSIGPQRLIGIRKVHKGMLSFGRSYMLMHSMSALRRIGFFDVLNERGVLRLDEFAKEKDLNPAALKALCNYLYSLRILNRTTKGFVLAKKGRSLLDYCLGTFDFIYAYAPIFERLEQLLYAKNGDAVALRRGEYVARATTEVSRWLPLPIVKTIVKRRGFKRVLDLGCGSGEFLIELCRENVLEGVGIDISADAVKYAQSNIASSGINGKISVLQGDIFNLGGLIGRIGSFDVATGMFVLHEFLSEGRDRVVQLLLEFRGHFPHTPLIISEVCKFFPSSLRKRRSALAEHHLFHLLSDQGLATLTGWRKIFRDAGYHIQEEIYFDFAGQAYFLIC